MIEDNDKLSSLVLVKTFGDMEVIHEALDDVEKYIYQKFDQLEARVNPKQDKDIQQGLRLYFSDYIQNLFQNIRH